MGHKFTLNSAFTLEHVLSNNDFIIVSDLNKALITAQGIKYFMTEHVLKVGISQKINILYHLWQKGDSFHIKRQIVLSNNFTDLLYINYFNCNIAKYKKTQLTMPLRPSCYYSTKNK